VEHATVVFSKEPQNVEEALKNEDAKVCELPCKKNGILLFLTTFGHSCHFPRVGSPFLVNGCSKSSMVSMEKLNVTR
jgi:hypothetical protein